MKVTVSISGRYYDRAAGAPAVLDLPPSATVDDALVAIEEDGRGGLGVLVPAALIAVSGQHVGTVADHAPQTLCEGDELFIFAPVAGG